MSSIVTRPLGCDGVTCSRCTPNSKARLRTAGAARTRYGTVVLLGGVETDATLESAVSALIGCSIVDGEALPTAFACVAVLNVTRTSPSFATVPSCTRIVSTVAATGEGISTTALSVSTSTIG